MVGGLLVAGRFALHPSRWQATGQERQSAKAGGDDVAHLPDAN